MIVVVLVAFVMVCEIAADVLAAYLVSPLYVTVMDFVPPLSGTPLARIVVPHLNVIVPVGVPLLELSTTLAVKVTPCP